MFLSCWKRKHPVRSAVDFGVVPWFNYGIILLTQEVFVRICYKKNTARIDIVPIV